MLDRIIVEKDVSKGRLEICNICQFNMGGICVRCGCILVAKTKLKNQKCPMGKWSAEE
jgi:hypothetical protein